MNNDNLNNELAKVSAQINDAAADYDRKNDTWWESELSEEEREAAFYAVAKRIHRAEIKEQRSYRGTLYDVFGFGTHMYARGMDCGYMAIHNSIFDGEEFMNLTQCKNVSVVDHTDRTNTVVSWNDVECISIDIQDQKVTINLNNRGQYV